MTQYGYTLITEQSGPRELVALRQGRGTGGLRLRGDERPLLPLAGRARACGLRLEHAGCGHLGHWDLDRVRAVGRAHQQFRWFGGGWKVNAELPGPAAFAAATSFVRPENVASAVPCGPNVDAMVAAVREYEEAGFTDVAVVQIGDESQQAFLEVAEKELLPALRAG